MWNRLTRSKTPKKFIAGLVLLGVLLSNTPQTKAVDVKDTTLDIGTCVALSAAVKVVEVVAAAASAGSAYKALKIAATFLGFGSGLALPDANIDFGKIVKTAIFDSLERCIARGVLDGTVAGILDTMRESGRDGGPTYVRNWRNFQIDAQRRGESIFRSILAGVTKNELVCEHLAEELRSAFGVTNRTKSILTDKIKIRIGDFLSYEERNRCTLPEGFDLDKFREDPVANGGLETFQKLLEPQNNIFGILLDSVREREKQQEVEKAADLAEVQANSGHLGIRGEGKEQSCRQKDDQGNCLESFDIQTPGSYVDDAVAATIQSELDWVTSVDELGELLINGLAKRLSDRLLNISIRDAPPEYAPPADMPEVCDAGINRPGCIAVITQLPNLPVLTPDPNGPLPTPEEVRECPRTGEQFRDAINVAIDSYIDENPDNFVFNADGSISIIGDVLAYMNGVTAKINSRSDLEARNDGFISAELQIKRERSTVFSEQWRIETSNRLVARRYEGTCRPSDF